jgi:hypothetical protein
MEELLKTKLIDLAKQKAFFDKEDELVVDWVGSNVDDAYDMGSDDGQILLAREILETFCIKY